MGLPDPRERPGEAGSGAAGGWPHHGPIPWRGHDLSFRQPELEGQVIDVAGVGDLATRKREPGFPLWGGEKTWLAPQAHWQEGSPFLDFERRGRGRGWMLDVSDVSGLGLVGDHKQVPVFPD